MVGPDHKGENGYRSQGINHRGVTKNWFSRKGLYYVGNNTKGRKNHYVNLWMPKEPENVLK